MTLRRPPRTLLVFSLFFIAASVAAASLVVFQERRNQSLIEIEAAHGELELALSSVALRLSGIASNVARTPDMSPSKFAGIVRDTTRSISRRHERAIALMPQLMADDLDALDRQIAAWRPDYDALGYPEFRLFPDHDGGYLFPVIFVEPEASRSNVFGYNLGSSTARSRAALRALETGQLTMTEPVALSQDSDTSQASFLVVHPLTMAQRMSRGDASPAILAASLTPEILFSQYINLFPRTIVDVTIGLGGPTPLSVRLSQNGTGQSDPLLIQLVEPYSMAPVRLPGLMIPVTAAAFYAPVASDLLLPGFAAVVALLFCLLLWRAHDVRENQREVLAAALARKEAELKESERLNVRAQRMEALGRLVGGVAHDFNNILGVILGNLELMREMDDRADTREFIDSALGATQRGAFLTKQLLAYGRRSHLRPERVNVAVVLRETSQMLERLLPSSISVTAAADAGLWDARVDRTGLENALLNLALNARDALDSKGQLTLEASNVRVTRDYLEARRDEDLDLGRYVSISVTDNGCGMDQQTLDRAFEPFFTTKHLTEGSGLGLPSVQGFCRQSGGACRIYSEPGVGTTIQLLLPVDEDAPERKAAEPAETPRAPIPAKVLLAEDAPALGDLMKQQLESEGYNVVLARSGDEAARHLDAGLEIDLVITDIVMTGNIQGPDLARRIEADRPDVEILLISGYPQEAAIAGNGVATRHIVLMKPVAKSLLIREVASLIEARRSKTAAD